MPDSRLFPDERTAHRPHALMEVRLVKGLLSLGLVALAGVAGVESLSQTIMPWDRWLYPLLATVIVLALVLLQWRPRWAPGIYLCVALGFNAYLAAAMLLALFAPLERPSVLMLATPTFWMPLGYVLPFLFLERRWALLLAGVTFGAIFLPSGWVLHRNAHSPWGNELLAMLINMGLAHITFVVALLAIGSLRQRYLMARERMFAMQVLASTDLLTGLPNRRALMEQLDEHLALAQRGRQTLSVMLIDIDHFKQVNDGHGHEVGDEVLTTLARLLASRVRACDLVGRWGGEEFLLLAPATHESEAWELAERIRQAVAGTVFPHGTPLTISLGVAEFRPGDHREALLRRADNALYSAKAGGRNQSCHPVTAGLSPSA